MLRGETKARGRKEWRTKREVLDEAFARYEEEETGGMVMVITERMAKQGKWKNGRKAEVAWNQLREENAEEGVECDWMPGKGG